MNRILVKGNIFVFIVLPLFVAFVFVLGIKNANAHNGAIVIKNEVCTLTGTIDGQDIVATTDNTLRLQTPQGNITVRCNNFEVEGEYIPPSRAIKGILDCTLTDFGNVHCPGMIILTPSGNINGVCHCNGRTR